MLAAEVDRVTKDFEDDQVMFQKVLKDLVVGSEIKSFLSTAVNVTLARNLALHN
jgi:hypothetical protein